MLSLVRLLLEMIRFSHTIFALPFAMLAAVMAWVAGQGGPDSVAFRWRDLLGIVVCMVAARSAAMAFNRIADREIDRLNPRTVSRHLPSGKIRLSVAWVFTVACCATFVAGTFLFLPNRLPAYLSVPVLAILLTYSYTKRMTALAHVWLGVALMLAPIAAWIAIRGATIERDIFDLMPAVILGIAVMFWVSGFDIIYACQDYEFDRANRLHSIPARMGIARSLKISAGFHLLTVISLALLPWSHRFGGPQLPWGWLYGLGVLLIAGLLVIEHALIRPDDLGRVNLAFFNVNAIISVGLLIVGIVDLLVV